MLHCSRNVPFVLMKLSNCSIMCLTDTGLIFAVDNQTGPADGSDELAVLGQSLDSVVHCCWTR